MRLVQPVAGLREREIVPLHQLLEREFEQLQGFGLHLVVQPFALIGFGAEIVPALLHFNLGRVAQPVPEFGRRPVAASVLVQIAKVVEVEVVGGI
ncbi:MAG: hypothetical protein EBY29_15815 [Planctomycetes bacterium]|nr:hypothetical protein [Planctomycetota bacterium]